MITFCDGKDEGVRPLNREEMQKGVEAYRKKRGRRISAARKEQVSVRYSPEVLAYFRSTGDGWQTRMDAALQLLVKKHPEWLKKLG